MVSEEIEKQEMFMYYPPEREDAYSKWHSSDISR